MAAVGNKVRFIQFNGYLSEWETMIHREDRPWSNAIVFGYIFDKQNNTILNKIYAGKDTYGVDYIFDFDKDLCRWNYGDVSKGWHDASAKITNKIGQINTNMTLGDLVSVTEGGELSRIIEMMLFKQASPLIILNAEQKQGAEKHAIKVSFKALNANECLMRIIDNDGKEIFNSPIATTYDNTFDQLVPNMTYHVIADASANDETVRSTALVTTLNATQPTVAFSNITCTPNTDNNYYKVSNIVMDVHSNDYSLDSVSTWKFGTDDNVTLALIYAKNVSYGVSYDIMQHYKGACIYKYPGDPSTYINFDSDTSTAFLPLPTGHDISILKVDGTVITASTPKITITNSSFEVEYGMLPRIYSGSVDMQVDNTVCNTSNNLTANTYKYVYNFAGKVSGDYTLNASLYDEYGYCCNSNSVTVNYQAAAPAITVFNISTYRTVDGVLGNTIESSTDLQAINYQQLNLKIEDISLNRTIFDGVVTTNPHHVAGLVLDTSYRYTAVATLGSQSDTSVVIYKTEPAVDATATIEDVLVNISTNTFAVNDLSINKVNNDYNFDTEYYTVFDVQASTYVCNDVNKTTFINDCSQLMRGKPYRFTVKYDTSCMYHYSGVASATKQITSNDYTYTAPVNIEYLYTLLSHSSMHEYPELQDPGSNYLAVNRTDIGYNIVEYAGYSTTNVIEDAILNPSFTLGGLVPAGTILNFIDVAKDVPYYDIRNDVAVSYLGKTYYKHTFTAAPASNTVFVMLIPNGYGAELWDSDMNYNPHTQLTFTKSTNTMTVNGKQYYVWYGGTWQTLSAGSTYFFYVY